MYTYDKHVQECAVVLLYPRPSIGRAPGLLSRPYVLSCWASADFRKGRLIPAVVCGVHHCCGTAVHRIAKNAVHASFLTAILHALQRQCASPTSPPPTFPHQVLRVYNSWRVYFLACHVTSCIAIYTTFAPPGVCTFL